MFEFAPIRRTDGRSPYLFRAGMTLHPVSVLLNLRAHAERRDTYTLTIRYATRLLLRNDFHVPPGTSDGQLFEEANRYVRQFAAQPLAVWKDVEQVAAYARFKMPDPLAGNSAETKLSHKLVLTVKATPCGPDEYAFHLLSESNKIDVGASVHVDPEADPKKAVAAKLAGVAQRHIRLWTDIRSY